MTNEEWYDAEVAPKLKQLAHAIQALRTISNKGREHPDPYIEGSWFAEIAETALCKVEDGDGEKSLRAQLARAKELLRAVMREGYPCAVGDDIRAFLTLTPLLREAGAAEGGEGK